MGQYRDFTIIYDPTPFPDRSHDWHWAHKEFDGAPDSGDERHGTASSFEDAKRQIDDWYINHHFPSALDDFIDTFATYPGISDDELIQAFEAKVSELRAMVRKLEGV